uniref:Citrate transporter-like domain-containing protein n=1 Tax=Megaselia scalaris TaxID=36166 RepID=T1GLJ7_MEGSC
MSCNEITIAILIVILLVLYLTRSPDLIPGWEKVIGESMQIKGALPTYLIVLAIYILPSSYKFLRNCHWGTSNIPRRVPPLMTWEYINLNIPWSLMFVVGAGLATVKANNVSGLIPKIADRLLLRVTIKPLELQIFEIIVVSIFLTAFSSNVSTAYQLFELLAKISNAAVKHPILIFYPAVLGCSMAFHLPVSTPPNAIACGYGNIRTKDIILSGIGPTIAAIILLETFGLFWAEVIYGKGVISVWPEWANSFNVSYSMK